MKNYIKPEILEEIIECEDICAASSGIGNSVFEDWSEGTGDSEAL